MKSTTVRFGDDIYRRLEMASEETGLPINSIVVAACLGWLKENHPHSAPTLPRNPWPSAATMRRMVPLKPSALAVAERDPLDMFTAAAQEVLAESQEEANRGEQAWIGTEHLIVALHRVQGGRASQCLRALHLDLDTLRAGLQNEPGETAAGGGAQRLPSRQVRSALAAAKTEARRERSERVGTDHLLLGLLLGGPTQATRLLEEAGVTELTVRRELAGIGPEE
jgi:Clp amino terminal domain, pathogenicity island component